MDNSCENEILSSERGRNFFLRTGVLNWKQVFLRVYSKLPIITGFKTTKEIIGGKAGV